MNRRLVAGRGDRVEQRTDAARRLAEQRDRAPQAPRGVPVAARRPLAGDPQPIDPGPPEARVERILAADGIGAVEDERRERIAVAQRVRLPEEGPVGVAVEEDALVAERLADGVDVVRRGRGPVGREAVAEDGGALRDPAPVGGLAGL